MDVKRCSKCSMTLGVDNFYFRNREKGHLFSHCITCIRKTRLEIRAANLSSGKTPEEAVCSSCHLTLPGSMFVKKLNTKRGISYSCRKCEKELREIFRATHKNIPISKKCGKCLQVLPSSAFYKNSAATSGLNYQCKTCQSAYSALRYRSIDKEQIKNKDSRRKEIRDALGDSYLRNLIAANVRRMTGEYVRSKDIPDEIVEVRRQCVSLNRRVKHGN